MIIDNVLEWFSVVAFFIGIMTLIAVGVKQISFPTELDKCHEYERAGVIRPGSCKCAEELFPNFSESYDWMDSCYILEKTKK